MINACSPDRLDAWNQFVLEHENGTIHHLAQWASIFDDTFNFPSFSVMFEDTGNHIQGILPLFEMCDIVRRRVLISSPFCNYSGVLAGNPSAESALIKHASDVSKQRKSEYVELRQFFDLTSPIHHRKKSFVVLKLDLSMGQEALWGNLASRNRGKIRKAANNGIKFRNGLQYLDDFYDLFVKNMHRLGTPAYPKKFFLSICNYLHEFIDLVVLEKQGHVIAGMFLFKFKDVVTEPWVASINDPDLKYINNLLYWQAICYACDQGFKYFDFGRSTVGSGTYRFKLHWRAKPHQLYYVYMLNRAKAVPVVDADENKYEILIQLWKKLPAFVVNRLGPWVVKYLPEL